jgi:hypothetical protein
MNELTLKKTKCIGRKWAYINTITGISVAFLIFVSMSNFSIAIEIIKEPNLYLGTGMAFFLSYLIGGIIVKQIINSRNYIIGKWIMSYFIIVFISVLFPVLISTLYYSGVYGDVYLFWTFIYPISFDIVGAIPILIFGYVFGRKLENEVMDLINKKEPKI